MLKEKKKKLPPGVRERDGRYTYRYSVEVVEGSQRRRKQKETKAYATPKEAYDAGILIEADKQRGKLVDHKNITLGEWRDRWLKDYKIEREPRPTTFRNRTVGLNSLCKAIGQNTRVNDIDGDEYQKFLNNLKLSGKKKGTIQEYHISAKMMFNDAVRKKIIPENPAANAAIPAFKQTLEDIESGHGKIPKFLEKDQLRKLLQYARFRGDPQDYPLFLVLAYSGLRIGELLALKTSDFNEEERTIRVTKTLTVLDSVKNYTLGPPKNKSSIRVVTIGESVIKALKSQMAWRQKKIDDGELLHDADFIFWSRPGYPASGETVKIRFRRMLKEAGLSDMLTPHSLRHTHVSLLAEAGEDLAVIQDRLGHKNDNITRSVYLHVTENQRKLIPDRFEQVMNS